MATITISFCLSWNFSSWKNISKTQQNISFYLREILLLQQHHSFIFFLLLLQENSRKFSKYENIIYVHIKKQKKKNRKTLFYMKNFYLQRMKRPHKKYHDHKYLL